jgi:hypothetical protein
MAFTVMVFPVPDWGQGWSREIVGGGGRKSSEVVGKRVGDEEGARDAMQED